MVSITPPLTITVPAGYGYVMMLATGVVPVFAWLNGFYVAASREKAGVPLPNAYATPQQMKANPKAYQFNCAQRAHANLLENMPQLMITTLIAGLEYPRTATALVSAWILLRAVYWAGYIYSNKPTGNGRLYGGFFWMCQGGLWGLSLAVASKLL